MNFQITQWHKDNPNDWVAVQGDGTTNDFQDPRHHILLGRAENLQDLVANMNGKDCVYGKAWGLGIGKEYPME